jgi:selenocysteine lyase/cysteine desulfurase
VSAGTSALSPLLPGIRARFPQLERLPDGRRRVYLDNAAGTLIPRRVASAMGEGALWLNPQPGRSWPSSPETQQAHRAARGLLRAFLNAPRDSRVYLVESTTTAFQRLRDALTPQWDADSNLVVTDCDHFANVSPWEWRAAWEVRRPPMLPDGHLDLERLAGLLDCRTRVVAMTAAGNGLGTIPRLQEAIALVRANAPGAKVVVDAVHAAPHLLPDVQNPAVDALAFSTYKLYGPCGGVLWVSESLLETLQPYHVEPHTEAETLLECGTLSSVAVSGVAAALDYLLELGRLLLDRRGAAGEERLLLERAYAAIREHELQLTRQLLPRLGELPGLQLFGIADAARAEERVPTFSFSAQGIPDEHLERLLWERSGLQVAAGSHYSAAVTRGLGRPTVTRASFAHYNTLAEANLLADVLEEVLLLGRRSSGVSVPAAKL